MPSNLCVSNEPVSTAWWNLCASQNRGPIPALLWGVQVLGRSPSSRHVLGTLLTVGRAKTLRLSRVCSLPCLHTGSRRSNQRKDLCLASPSELGNLAKTGSCLGHELFRGAHGFFPGWLGCWSFFSRVRSSHSEISL